MRKKLTSVEYAMHLANVSRWLYITVVQVRDELGRDACRLDSYLPMLFSRLGDQALGEMIGCKYPDDEKAYFHHDRKAMIRRGISEKVLDRIDSLARECFYALGLLEE